MDAEIDAVEVRPALAIGSAPSAVGGAVSLGLATVAAAVRVGWGLVHDEGPSATVVALSGFLGLVAALALTIVTKGSSSR